MNSRIFLSLISIAFHISLSAQTPYNSNADAQNLDLTSGYHHLIGNHLECKDSYFHEDAEVHLESATGITILPNTKINNISSGNHFKATIGNVMNVADMLGNWNPDKFEKFELGVSVPSNVNASIQDYFNTGTGLNPYNPNEVSVECYFVGPSGIPHVRHGFFYRDFTVNNTTNGWTELPTIYSFRVRFSPPEAGLYSFQVNCKVSNQSVSLFSGTFMVNNSSDPGFLEMSNGGDRKLRFQNGQIFFAIGQNIPYAMDPMNVYQCGKPLCGADAPAYNQQRNFMLDLANNGGNFVRIRMDPWSNPIISTERSVFPGDPAPKPQIECIYNYDHNQRHMWELDRTFDFCTEHDLFIMLCIFQDQYWSINGPADWAQVYNWTDNPFSALLGTSEQGLMNFFSDPASEEYFKRVLYYIQARWGYSTHLAIWELGNEVDNIGNTSQGKLMLTNSQFQSTVNTWLCNMSAYLQSNFDGNYFYPWHPLTIGCTDNSGYTYSDCVNIWSKNSYNHGCGGGGLYQSPNYNGRKALATNYFNSFKPFIFGELGASCGDDPTIVIDQFSDWEFHNSIWATSMMGGIGTGLYWNDFEQINNINHRSNFKSLRYFFDHVTWDRNFNVETKMNWTDGGDEEETVQIFYLISEDHERVIGWAQLGCKWWLQDNEIPLNIRNDLIACTGVDDNKYYSYEFPYTGATRMPAIEITDLGNWGAQYRIKIFSTFGNGEKIAEINDGCGIRGNLRFYFPLHLPVVYPYYSDFAFLIEKFGTYNERQVFPSTEIDSLRESEISINKNVEPILIYGSNDRLNINLLDNEMPLSVTVIDLLGRVVAEEQIVVPEIKIQNISTGAYIAIIKYKTHAKIYRFAILK